jgi:membrane protease YdiL (CAAX protease family)
MQTLRQIRTLSLLVLRYWARAGLPNRLRNDRGRRASGALLRATFLLLMVNWGYRIGVACLRVDASQRSAAVSWLLIGLVSLSVTWGAMGRGPGMRGPQSAMTSPLLDALPLTEASRVVINLFERLMLYALGGAAFFALVPSFRVDVLLLAVALPTAGLVVGDAALRLMRTIVSPMRMARVSAVALVMQFPSFMLIGGAPVLAKLPRAAQAVRWVEPAASALVEGQSIARLLVAMLVLGLMGAFAIRTAERIGYDRIDIVPTRKLDAVPSAALDLVGIEKVLATREPGGRWMARGAFLYTLAASGGLLAISLLSKGFAKEGVVGSTIFVRSLGYVAIFSGFAVVQARATRMVTRDAGARAMLAPLPIGPSDLLQGKRRALLLQALVVASPYFLLLGMPGPPSLHFEVLWRGLAAMTALALAASAIVAVAFLTQGLGGVKVLGGNVGIETTLVAMPLLAVAAAPYLWSAVVSLVCLAVLAFEARRSALQCVRWIDDGDDFERETPVWRALLVFAAFQAAQTLGRRALALAPIDEHIQAALAYVVAALALLALTMHGRRGLPRMRALPARAMLWMLVALVAGLGSGSFAAGYRAFLRHIGVEVPPGATDGDVRLVIAAVTIVLAPIAEETFFRGWLQNTIDGELPERRRWLAPLLAALAFASVRAPMSLVPIFVLGVVTGLLYARTRSVGPAIAAHAAHVAVSLAARYYLGV